ncbi:MAG TPA: DNA alkylation repair protein [Bacillales bacterium]
MTEPYLCPGCGTNRTWFNKIKQQDTSVKLDPATGETTDEFPDGDGLPPFAFSYNGPEYQIQCGICGLIGDEERFVKTAQHKPRTVRS